MISKIPSTYDNNSVTSFQQQKADSEEKDRKLAEERAEAARKLQRKQRLEAMVQKRKTNFAYLKVI